MRFDPNIKLLRLFRAADVLLKAMESKQGMNSLIAICFNIPHFDAEGPAPRYTLIELADAMTMLTRMGYVPAHPLCNKAKKSAAHHGIPLPQAQPKKLIVMKAARTPLAMNGVTMN